MENSIKESIVKKYVTQKGELTGFISIFKPSTIFNKEGVYSAAILLSKEEGESLAEELKYIRTEQFKMYGKGTKAADIINCVPYSTVDKETGEEILDTEGRYIVKTKANAYIKNDKPSVKIPVFDSKQNPVKDLNVGAGTTARLALSLEGYSVAKKTGVSIKLKAVQIIDLVEYNSGTADSYGFEEEEGSFEFSKDNAETEAAEEEDF